MLMELINTFRTNIVEINVVKDERMNDVLTVCESFTVCEKIQKTEHDVYCTFMVGVNSRDTKTFKRIIKNMNGVISVQ